MDNCNNQADKGKKIYRLDVSESVSAGTMYTEQEAQEACSKINALLGFNGCIYYIEKPAGNPKLG